MPMNAAQEHIRALASCYETEVLKQRHRTVTLRGRKCDARIMLTLLGFEVKAGRKRISCPDMTTARYLRLFAEIGMRQIRMPYDPTSTARVIPRLESALKRIQESVSEQAHDPTQRKALTRRVYRELRGTLLGLEENPSARR